ncbi:methylated-DNA--protein-cysteine methyltransferase [Legionella massiliensis]|uniref:Methylated-DNA--protein-cysteine methyltransferase n=1 Tax=Legionella massiliensis TaxID=1034943 RepID=A0A078L4K3_9GAMM|nr:MGMT family protein [Legionella massiliensis]CDZ78999.1 methylated-DNA--protein-cysteine methyltransferase [Legionella massiliensis]CEE14737.1 Methylated-DNA--protein-cysteine methyltransferase [Legionella massiliensis]
MDLHTEFSKEVLKLIKSIPKGKVATYGLIAKLAGNSRGARGVGWLLHSCTRSHDLPWQRVIKSSGQLSFPFGSPQYSLQKQLLDKEGVSVSNGRVDLKKYLWSGETTRQPDDTHF